MEAFLAEESLLLATQKGLRKPQFDSDICRIDAAGKESSYEDEIDETH
jgi:hypothetical protein